MRLEAMERHLQDVYKGLVQADELGERREYMNALLRIVAMICAESEDEHRSMEIAFSVIEAAINEPKETLN